MTEFNFTEEWIPVSDLVIDRDIQRGWMDNRKIERIVHKFNPAALGVITVSRRNAATNAVIDGMHRKEAVARVTSNEGKLLCHVFKGLSKAEEAQMFLDLNAGSQPTLFDKFKVRIVAEDQDAISINQTVHAYGWTLATSPARGNIVAVGTLEKIYRIGQRLEIEPDLLATTLMLITHAWDTDPEGALANILEGVAALQVEYGDQLDLKRLEQKLRMYPGGPRGLFVDAQVFAASRKGRVAMGVAERLVDEYNVGMKGRALHPWRKRR